MTSVLTNDLQSDLANANAVRMYDLRATYDAIMEACVCVVNAAATEHLVQNCESHDSGDVNFGKLNGYVVFQVGRLVKEIIEERLVPDTFKMHVERFLHDNYECNLREALQQCGIQTTILERIEGHVIAMNGTLQSVTHMKINDDSCTWVIHFKAAAEPLTEADCCQIIEHDITRSIEWRRRTRKENLRESRRDRRRDHRRDRRRDRRHNPWSPSPGWTPQSPRSPSYPPP